MMTQTLDVCGITIAAEKFGISMDTHVENVENKMTFNPSDPESRQELRQEAIDAIKEGWGQYEFSNANGTLELLDYIDELETSLAIWRKDD